MMHARNFDQASSAFHAGDPGHDGDDAAPERAPRGMLLALALGMLLWSAVIVAILILR